MKRNKVSSMIKNTIVGIFALGFVIVPFWMVLINSFKPLAEANKLGLGFPKTWNVIENYSRAIIEGKLIRGFFNTLIVAIIAITIVIILASMASWIYARIKKKAINVLYYCSISGILIPPAVITSIRVLKALHIHGHLGGLIAFYCGAIISFAIFFITGFIKTIPIDLEDSARIDGASNIVVFFKIVFPLLQPVIATCVIILTIFIWNDFIYPFYFISNTRRYTMTLGLFNVIAGTYRSTNWHLVFANVIAVSLPLLILFFILQRKIIAGIMGGAIKG